MLVAFKQAVAEIDDGQHRAVEPDELEDAAQRSWEYERPRRQGRVPSIQRGGQIADYSHEQLVTLARWIKSDTLLRTEDQMLDEMMNELGFQRRGSRIVEELTKAIRDA